MNNQTDTRSPANCSSWTEFLYGLRTLVAAGEPGLHRSALNTDAASIFSITDLVTYVQRNHNWLANSANLEIVSRKENTKMNALTSHFDSILTGSGPDAAAVFLLDCYCSGDTIVINYLDRCWQSVGRLLDSIEDRLRLICNCNTYLTRAYSQGFELHSDAHDVLVIQTQGSKLWQFHQRDTSSGSSCHKTPLANPLQREDVQTDNTVSPREVRLNSGDVLYLPQGCKHRARTEGEGSVHLTVGFKVPRNSDRAIEIIQTLSAHYPTLRNRTRILDRPPDETVPYDKKLIEEIVNILNSADIPKSTEFIRRKISPRTRFADYEGERLLESMLSTDRIKLNSHLRIPEGHKFGYFYKADGRVYIRTTQELPLPDSLAFVVEFLTTNACFKVRDLPNRMGEQSKIRLCRNLARKGLYIWYDELVETSDQILETHPLPAGDK